MPASYGTARRIEIDFTYHPPKNEIQKEGYERIRAKAKELLLLMYEYQDDSREMSLAQTKIEEAVFWANAGIARNT